MTQIEPTGGQRRLDDFVTDAGRCRRDRCEAYADSTGDRCKRDAVAPFPYCSDHMHLLDAVDLKRMGLKRPKSGG